MNHEAKGGTRFLRLGSVAAKPPEISDEGHGLWTGSNIDAAMRTKHTGSILHLCDLSYV